MKKILIILLPVLFIFSCQNSDSSTAEAKVEVKEAPMEPVRIAGTIENALDEVVSLYGGDVKVETPHTDGKFELNLELNKPTFLTFKHGSERSEIYLEPGDDITLTLNPEQFDETLKLAGKGAEESNYLLAKYLLNEKYSEKIKENFSLEVPVFEAKMEEIKTAHVDHFAQYQKDHSGMNKDFIDNENGSIVYEWANNKLNYKGYYEYFTKKDAADVDLSFMDKIDLNNETHFESNGLYKQMISTYLNTLGGDAGKGTESLKAIFDVADSKISSNVVKGGLLFNILTDHLNWQDATGVDVYVEKFNKMSTNEKDKEKLAATYTTASSLMKGKPAPTFNYKNTSGEEVPLESLKGKSVYVDVWATWCGPCKREIPSLKELEKTYHGNDDIVFMSVSIDKMKDKEKWLNMVEEKELSGVQLMADNDWKSSICEDYAIRGIPRFILIDKDGNILDKNAPRPSSSEIKEVLADLAKPGMTSMK